MKDDREQVLEAGGDALAAALAQLRPGDPEHAAYPVGEAQYWREAFVREPYYQPGRGFEDYATAYELGWVAFHLYGGEFDTAGRVMANDWLVRKGVSTLSWDDARPAVRAGWQRAHNARSFATDGTAAPQAVQAVLGELLASARDGELGFREAASHARSPELVALFERLADRCAAGIVQWNQALQELGGEAGASGTVAGAAQRAWLQIRGLFGGAGDETLLAECERGQDDIVHTLREALQRNLPTALHEAVHREFEQAQRQHDHLKRLRDRRLAPAAAGELAA
jgi:uncharacterized protein (TIGR02284 family)